MSLRSDDDFVAYVRGARASFRVVIKSWICLYAILMLGVSSLGTWAVLRLISTQPFRIWPYLGLVAGATLGFVCATVIIALFRPDDFFVSRVRVARQMVAYHDALQQRDHDRAQEDVVRRARHELVRRRRPSLDAISMMCALLLLAVCFLAFIHQVRTNPHSIYLAGFGPFCVGAFVLSLVASCLHHSVQELISARRRIELMLKYYDTLHSVNYPEDGSAARTEP
jgi:hypothetical protein